jgi:hypothetical protein
MWTYLDRSANSALSSKPYQARGAEDSPAGYCRGTRESTDRATFSQSSCLPRRVTGRTVSGSTMRTPCGPIQMMSISSSCRRFRNGLNCPTAILPLRLQQFRFTPEAPFSRCTAYKDSGPSAGFSPLARHISQFGYVMAATLWVGAWPFQRCLPGNISLPYRPSSIHARPWAPGNMFALDGVLSQSRE